MTLLSLEFFSFLLFGVAAYYASPVGWRIRVLSLLCLIFYALCGALTFIYIILSVALSYGVALALERMGGRSRSRLAALSVAMLIIAWIILREGSVSLGYSPPLGISFYTLRAVSYLVDVKTGRARAERDPMKCLLYTAFFPMSFLGPVTKYREGADRLFHPTRASWDNISGGALRIIWGIFKKTVVADALIRPISTITSAPDRYFGVYSLILILLYTTEVYFDFSGGIDIALGASRLFGVVLPENFNKPFSSKTLAEFWNRWHITLGEWVEEYVFYPVSLSAPMQRVSKFLRGGLGRSVGKRIPLYFSVMLSWLFTGFWHGSRLHFLWWGVLNGGLVILSGETARAFGKISKRHGKAERARGLLSFLAPIRVLLVIGAVRTLDVYKSLGRTVKMLASALVPSRGYFTELSDFESVLPMHTLAIALVGILAAFAVSRYNIRAERLCRRPFALCACAVLLLCSSLLLGSYGYGFCAEDFIYSQY